MLTKDDNDMLVRSGRETAMGALLRRFWIPALLSEEISVSDGPPVRVGLLGERLVAFRDTEGRIGLLDAYCPHRRVNLFWGRNEECGLRCVYHGWKFDVDGNCVDLPNVEKGESIKEKVRTTSYPTIERGGMVWAYLGPPELKPPFPAAEIFDLPPSHRHIQKIVMDGNWIQFMEGDIDTSHVSFLHSMVDGSSPIPESFIRGYQFVDSTPHYTIRPTSYGLALAARRQADQENYSWRITQWLMPFSSMIAARRDSAFFTNVRVPIDDERSTQFRIVARIDQPLTDDDKALIDGGIMMPEMVPGTFQPKANITNDYLIDRSDQKSGSYTGIKSIPMQDYAVTQDQGYGWIADRSLEFLTSSDAAIVAVRRRLLQAAKALRDGKEPAEPANPEAYRIRPIDTVAPKDTDLSTAIKQALPDYETSFLEEI